MHLLKEPDAPGKLLPLFTLTTFCNFLFVFLHPKPLLTWRLLYEKSIYCYWERILSFETRSKKRGETILTAASLESVPISLKEEYSIIILILFHFSVKTHLYSWYLEGLQKGVTEKDLLRTINKRLMGHDLLT